MANFVIDDYRARNGVSPDDYSDEEIAEWMYQHNGKGVEREYFNKLIGYVPPRPDSFIDDIANVGVDALQGVGDLARVPFGIAGMVPGLHYAADPIARGIGRATDWVGEQLHTDEYLRGEEAIRAAGRGYEDDFWGQFRAQGGAMLENPLHIAGGVARTLPLMFGGGAMGRAALAPFGVNNAAIAGRVGEGLASGGLAAAEIAERSGEGYDVNRLMGIPIGAATAGLAYGANRLMPNVADVDTAAARIMGSAGAAVTERVPRNLLSRVALGGLKEGPLEEGSQTFFETGLQNVALGEPFMRNTGGNTAEGAIIGSAMGGGYNVFTGGKPEQASAPTNPWADPNAPRSTPELPGMPQDMMGPATTAGPAFYASAAARLTELEREWARNQDMLAQGYITDPQMQAKMAEAQAALDTEIRTIWDMLPAEYRAQIQGERAQGSADMFDSSGQQEMFLPPSAAQDPNLMDAGSTAADAQSGRGLPVRERRQLDLLYPAPEPTGPTPLRPADTTYLRGKWQKPTEGVQLDAEGRAVSPMPQRPSLLELGQWKEQHGMDLTREERLAVDEDRIAKWQPTPPLEVVPSRGRSEVAGPPRPLDSPIRQVQPTTGQQEIRLQGTEDTLSPASREEKARSDAQSETSEARLFRALSVGEKLDNPKSLSAAMVTQAGKELNRAEEAARIIAENDVNAARELLADLDYEQNYPTSEKDAREAQTEADAARNAQSSERTKGFEAERSKWRQAVTDTLKRWRPTTQPSKKEELAAKIRQQRARVGQQTWQINQEAKGVGPRQMPLTQDSSLPAPISMPDFARMDQGTRKTMLTKLSYDAWRRGWIDEATYKTWQGYLDKGNYARVRKEHEAAAVANSNDVAQAEQERRAGIAAREQNEEYESPPLSVASVDDHVQAFYEAKQAEEKADRTGTQQEVEAAAGAAQFHLAALFDIIRHGHPDRMAALSKDLGMAADTSVDDWASMSGIPTVQSVSAEAVVAAEEAVAAIREHGLITPVGEIMASERAKRMAEGAGNDVKGNTSETNAKVQQIKAKFHDSSVWNTIKAAARRADMLIDDFLAGAVNYITRKLEDKPGDGALPNGWTNELMQLALSAWSNTAQTRSVRTQLDKDIPRFDPTSTSAREPVSTKAQKLTSAVLARVVEPDPTIAEDGSALGQLKEMKRRLLHNKLANAVNIANEGRTGPDVLTTPRFIQLVAQSDSIPYVGRNPALPEGVAAELQSDARTKQEAIDEVIRLLKDTANDLGLRGAMNDLRVTLGGKKAPRGSVVDVVRATAQASDTYTDTPASLIDREVRVKAAQRAEKALDDAQIANREGKRTKAQAQTMQTREQAISTFAIPALVGQNTRISHITSAVSEGGRERISTLVQDAKGKKFRVSVEVDVAGKPIMNTLVEQREMKRAALPTLEEELARLVAEIADVEARSDSWNKARTELRPLARVEVAGLQREIAAVKKSIRYNKGVDAQNAAKEAPAEPESDMVVARKPKKPEAGEVPTMENPRRAASTLKRHAPTDTPLQMRVVGKLDPNWGAEQKVFSGATTLGEALRRIVTAPSTSAVHRQLARLLLRTDAANAALKTDAAATGSPGEYFPQAHRVELRRGGGTRVLLHEAIHAAIYLRFSRGSEGRTSVDTQSEAMLRKLYEAAAQEARKQGLLKDFGAVEDRITQHYGLVDVQEFISEAFTNPDFQKFLASIEAPAAVGKNTSLWGGFVSFVRRALGLQSIPNSVLDNVLIASARMITAQDTRATTASAREASLNAAPATIPFRAAVAGNPVTKQLSDFGRRGMMHAMFGHQIARYAAEHGLSSAAEYFNAMSRKNKIKVSIEKQVEDLATMFSRLGNDDSRRIVNEHLNEARRSGKWGYKPSWMTDAQYQKLSDDATRGRHAALNEDQQAVVMAVLEHTHEMRRRKYAALNAEINAEYDALLKDAKTDEEKKELAAERKSAIGIYGTPEKLNEGPYVPFKRFGDIVVVAKSVDFQNAEDTNSATKLRKLKSDPNHYQVHMATNVAEASRIRDELVEKFGSENVYDTVKEDSRSIYGQEMPFHFVKRIREMAREEFGDSSDAVKSVNRLMTDLYLTMLQDERGRKSELESFLVAGEEKDTMRAVVAQGVADAHLISSVEGNDAVVDLMGKMRDQKKAKPGQNGIAAARVYNEIMKRHAASLVFDSPLHWQEKATSMTSFWMLITSPSYWIANMLQTPTMTMSNLSGDFSAAKAWSTWLSVSKDVFAADLDAFDVEKLSKDTNEQKMLAELYNRGRIDITLAMDLGRLARNGTISKYGGLIGRSSEVAHTAFEKVVRIPHHVEMFNRVSSALTAYRLAMKSGKYTHEKALEYADTIVIDTHGDYSGINAPRLFMQGAHPGLPIKMMTQFRKFQLIQLGHIARLVRQSFKGAAPEERNAARAALLYTTGSIGALAGGLGVPFGYTLAAVVFAAMDAGDDEDEGPKIGLRAISPFATASDRALIEDRIRAAVKNPELATLIISGLPALAGVDLSGSVGAGMAGQLFPYAREGATATESVAYGLLALSGPFVGGLVPRMAEGIGQIAAGDYASGMVKVMPKGIGSFIDAGKLASEGLVDRNGVHLLTPEEIGAAGLLGRAIGFPPTKATERSGKQQILRMYEDFFSARGRELKKEFVEARRNKESITEIQANWREMQDARARLGFKRQPMADLMRHERSVEKKGREAREGVIVSDSNKKFFDRYE